MRSPRSQRSRLPPWSSPVCCARGLATGSSRLRPESAGTSARHPCSAESASSLGLVAGVGAAVVLGADARQRARGDPRRLRRPLRRRPRRRLLHAPPDREARGAVRRRRNRPRFGALGRDRRLEPARDHPRRRLAGRDHERVQPARQHGRAGRVARGGRLRRVRRRCDLGRLGRPRGRRRARARRRLRRLPPVQPATRPQGRRLHGRLRQPGDRVRARLARARLQLDDGRSDADEHRAAAAGARDPDPRHDPRDGPTHRSSGVRSRKVAPTTRRTGSSTTASPNSRLWRR